MRSNTESTLSLQQRLSLYYRNIIDYIQCRTCYIVYRYQSIIFVAMICYPLFVLAQYAYTCTCQLSIFRKRETKRKCQRRTFLNFLYFTTFTFLQKEGHMAKSLLFFCCKMRDAPSKEG